MKYQSALKNLIAISPSTPHMFRSRDIFTDEKLESGIE